MLHKNTITKIIHFFITVGVLIGSLFYSSMVLQAEEIPVDYILLNKYESTLKVGETEQLIVTVMPQNATFPHFEWESGDESIVTVDEFGIMTAIGPGVTMITAFHSLDGYTVEATCFVTVSANEPDDEPQTTITLNKDSLSFTIGDIDTLIALIAPDEIAELGAKWSSSNTSIVEVDDFGNISALKVGTIIITAETADGKASATCTITVLEADKSELQDYTAFIEKEYPTKDDYTEDSWKDLKNALDDALDVINNENATPQEIKEALNRLKEAREGLQKDLQQNEPKKPNEPLSPETPNEPLAPKAPNEPQKPTSPTPKSTDETVKSTTHIDNAAPRTKDANADYATFFISLLILSILIALKPFIRHKNGYSDQK